MDLLTWHQTQSRNKFSSSSRNAVAADDESDCENLSSRISPPAASSSSLSANHPLDRHGHDLRTILEFTTTIENHKSRPGSIAGVHGIDTRGRNILGRFATWRYIVNIYLYYDTTRSMLSKPSSYSLSTSVFCTLQLSSRLTSKKHGSRYCIVPVNIS